MDYIKTFESSFKSYVDTFVKVDENSQPLNFFEFVRNEIRKKNLTIFSNLDKGTFLVRYKGDKEKMDWSDPFIRNSRSLIVDNETHETLMVAPPKSGLYDEFKVHHPEITTVFVEDFPSGPMINLYNHPRKGWQIATRSFVGAGNNFRCGDKSFAKLFDEALLKTTGLSFDEFVVNLDTSNTFSFVLTHPDYFDVARYAEPSIFLVEVRDRTQNQMIVEISQVKEYFESKSWTIKFPKRHSYLSWHVMEEYIKTQPAQEQGLVVRFDNERAKIRNPDFIVSRDLLGNHTNMVDIFAENLQKKTTNDFLIHFPEKMKDFDHYTTLYQEIVSTTHAYYVAHNTRPAGQKIEFSEVPVPLKSSIWNIHRQYLESGTSTETRRPVKMNVVELYFRTITPIELATVLTYWDKYVQEKKSEGGVKLPQRFTSTQTPDRKRTPFTRKIVTNTTPATTTTTTTPTVTETREPLTIQDLNYII
jgi:hypothetical protein